MNSDDKFLCIVNKSTGEKFYNSKGLPFKSKVFIEIEIFIRICLLGYLRPVFTQKSQN